MPVPVEDRTVQSGPFMGLPVWHDLKAKNPTVFWVEVEGRREYLPTTLVRSPKGVDAYVPRADMAAGRFKTGPNAGRTLWYDEQLKPFVMVGPKRKYLPED
jgi:hypothetical protein